MKINAALSVLGLLPFTRKEKKNCKFWLADVPSQWEMKPLKRTDVS